MSSKKEKLHARQDGLKREASFGLRRESVYVNELTCFIKCDFLLAAVFR